MRTVDRSVSCNKSDLRDNVPTWPAPVLQRERLVCKLFRKYAVTTRAARKAIHALQVVSEAIVPGSKKQSDLTYVDVQAEISQTAFLHAESVQTTMTVGDTILVHIRTKGRQHPYWYCGLRQSHCSPSRTHSLQHHACHMVYSCALHRSASMPHCHV